MIHEGNADEYVLRERKVDGVTRWLCERLDKLFSPDDFRDYWGDILIRGALTVSIARPSEGGSSDLAAPLFVLDEDSEAQPAGSDDRSVPKLCQIDIEPDGTLCKDRLARRRWLIHAGDRPGLSSPGAILPETFTPSRPDPNLWRGAALHVRDVLFAGDARRAPFQIPITARETKLCGDRRGATRIPPAQLALICLSQRPRPQGPAYPSAGDDWRARLFIQRSNSAFFDDCNSGLVRMAARNLWRDPAMIMNDEGRLWSQKSPNTTGGPKKQSTIIAGAGCLSLLE